MFVYFWSDKFPVYADRMEAMRKAVGLAFQTAETLSLVP